jgi:hypothetical protein
MGDFGTVDEYDSAMDAYDAQLRKDLRAEVESTVKVTMTAEQVAVQKAESAIRAWAAEQGDKVTTEQVIAASTALGKTIARKRAVNPDWHKSYRPEQAVESVEAAIEAMRGAAPKTVPAKPNPVPRRVPAASVTTTRGTPQAAAPVPAYRKEGREPTYAEAWAEAEQEVRAQGARPTARNGAVK